MQLQRQASATTEYDGFPCSPPQNSFAPLNQWWNPRWIKYPPVQAPDETKISQTPRANIPDGDVAIKPSDFGVKDINGTNSNVFLNMWFTVDWSAATPARVPWGIPTQGPFRAERPLGR